MRAKAGALFVAAVLLGSGAIAAEPEEGPRLTVGVVGSTPADPHGNPSAILDSPGAQRLVLEIAERPMSRAELEQAIADEFFSVEDLVGVGLVREEGGLFHLDFNLLRVADQRAILEVAERLGRDLASAFLERREELAALAARHDQPHVETATVLYLVVGCFSLDWDGLKVTRQLGYREAAQRTIDGSSFTPWAKEKGTEVSVKGLYWGSHNSGVGGTTFTTFGDHDALPRAGLPDLMWQMGGAFAAYEEYPKMRRAAGRMLYAYVDQPLQDIAAVMKALRREDLSAPELALKSGVAQERLALLLPFLESVDYVQRFGDDWGGRVLVLESDDEDTVRGLVRVGREIIVRWHEDNFESVRAALSDLTPGRNGVPFERVYNEVWHFVFAIANRTLVEEGVFADPYAETRRYKGFIPVVWAAGLADLDW